MKFTLWLLLLVTLTFFSCSSDELDRSTAKDILKKEYAQSLKSSCSVNPLLVSKPEFTSIKDEPICEAEFVVTGIQKISETMSVVEAKKVSYVLTEPAQKWLAAFTSLENRLSTLRARRYYSWQHYGPIWEFTDEVDGQKFIGLAGSGEPENIKDTDKWKELQNLKNIVETLLQDGKSESASIQIPFQLYDDGWRIVKKQ